MPKKPRNKAAKKPAILCTEGYSPGTLSGSNLLGLCAEISKGTDWKGIRHRLDSCLRHCRWDGSVMAILDEMATIADGEETSRKWCCLRSRMTKVKKLSPAWPELI